MPSVPFERMNLRRGWALAAARGSVFLPVYGPPAGRDPVRANRNLVHAWRDRLSALRDAGWPPAQGLRFGFLWNCPPCGLEKVGPVLRCCGLLPCPWCHMRRVVGAVVRISRLQQRLGPAGRRPLVLAQTAGLTVPATRPEVALAQLLSGRLAAVRARPNVGCVAYSYLAGTGGASDAGFSVVARRNLLYLPVGAAGAAADPGRRASDVDWRPEGLVRVAPEAFPYPDWFLSAPAERVVALLGARRGLRAFTYYNELYRVPEPTDAASG